MIASTDHHGEEAAAPLLPSPPLSPFLSSWEDAIEPSRFQPIRRRRQCRLCSNRRACRIGLFAVASSLILAVFLRGLALNPTPERAADLQWIATADSTLDRIACRWFSICGLHHRWQYSEPSSFGRPEDLFGPQTNFSAAWVDPALEAHPEDAWSPEERARRTIPAYVLDYAPYIYLHEDERYWPSDPAEHLAHSTVQRGGLEPSSMPWNLSLATLGQLNDLPDSFGGGEVFLTSMDDAESRPEWLLSRRNRPGYGSDGSDYSAAPAVLICVPKDDGVLDAFFFFFYSFNEGNTVLGTRYGNHVGDWEHTMVRFQHAEPQALYLSRHSWGSAYTFDAMEKIEKRPVVYSGNGSHAHYPTAGNQPYVLPFGMLKDVTGRGSRWDPVRNYYGYVYESESGGGGQGTFLTATQNPRAPTSWLEFNGRWGDARYALNDPRQYRFFGETHFGDGPTGPRDKRLEREGVCDSAKCQVEDHL